LVDKGKALPTGEAAASFLGVARSGGAALAVESSNGATTGALDEGAARGPLALGAAATADGVADGTAADADADADEDPEADADAEVDAGIRALSEGCAAAEPVAEVASAVALESSAGAGGLGGSQKIAK
jgi:hypothetical protein